MTKPFFSIVVASYLGEYRGNFGRSATEREYKFHRALRSVYEQTDMDFELIVVADGCATTWSFREQYMAWEVPVRFLRVSKQRLWSEVVRNTGIAFATGRYIVYLDTDDYWGADHLLAVRAGLAHNDMPRWAIMDDHIWSVGSERWEQQISTLDRPASVGTSNLVHEAGLFWPKIEFRHPAQGYDHDRQFVRYLRTLYSGGVHIGAGHYHVCHIPGQYDI